MTHETKKLAIQALWSLRGDDYERAKRAFASRTSTQMREIYGYSGKTYEQILKEYKDHADKIQSAIKEISNL